MRLKRRLWAEESVEIGDVGGREDESIVDNTQKMFGGAGG